MSAGDLQTPSVHKGPEEVEKKPTKAKGLKQSAVYPYRLAALAIFLGVWYASSTTWLPTVPDPVVVGRELWGLLTSAEYYREMSRTTLRVAGGFSVAFTVGLLIGTAMGLSRRAEALFELPILTGVAAPGLFIAMIVLVAFGINNTAAILGIAVISVPTIIVTFWQATKALNRELGEMAAAFGFNRWEQVRHIIMPQLLPPALAATRYGLGLAWKLVVLVELLGLSSGVGYQVTFYYQLFNLRMVLAWTIGFLLFVLVVEYVVIRPIEGRLTHWRTHSTRGGRRVVGADDAVATGGG
jgi:NitT/TauT family transport system permease protein